MLLEPVFGKYRKHGRYVLDLPHVFFHELRLRLKAETRLLASFDVCVLGCCQNFQRLDVTGILLHLWPCRKFIERVRLFDFLPEEKKAAQVQIW